MLAQLCLWANTGRLNMQYALHCTVYVQNHAEKIMQK